MTKMIIKEQAQLKNKVRFSLRRFNTPVKTIFLQNLKQFNCRVVPFLRVTHQDFVTRGCIRPCKLTSGVHKDQHYIRLVAGCFLRYSRLFCMFRSMYCLTVDFLSFTLSLAHSENIAIYCSGIFIASRYLCNFCVNDILTCSTGSYKNISLIDIILCFIRVICP